MAADKRYWEDVKEGDALPEIRVEKLTRTDFVKYAGASGDFNPIHHDQTFAEASGNPTVFAMGMLNASILSRVVTAFAGRPNVRRYKVRFATRAWPGDDVICRGRVTKKLAHGRREARRGRARGRQPEGRDLDQRQLCRGSALARLIRSRRRNHWSPGASWGGCSANHCTILGMSGSNGPGMDRLSTPARHVPTVLEIVSHPSRHEYERPSRGVRPFGTHEHAHGAFDDVEDVVFWMRMRTGASGVRLEPPLGNRIARL